MTPPADPAALAAGAALAGWPLACVLLRLLRALGLERSNYEGRPLLTGGGLLFLVAALPWLALTPPAAAAACGFGLLGFIDDRWGSAEAKGLRGHFGALRRGRITTGLVKAVGGSALAMGLAWSVHPGWRALPGAAVIALAANFFNLLDLRPLRALKAFWALSILLLATGGPLLWQTLGLTVPYALLEARRRVMLGDTGANLLGGLLGFTAARTIPLWGQAALACLLVAFHVWAERNSLSRWIAGRSWARAVDSWGWSGDSTRQEGQR